VTHQGVSHPANRSVGFCPFAIATPARIKPIRERLVSEALIKQSLFRGAGNSQLIHERNHLEALTVRRR